MSTPSTHSGNTAFERIREITEDVARSEKNDREKADES
jgi:hypothetical protein